MDTDRTLLRVADIIAIAVLLAAIPDGVWPYAYFVFLRWITAAAAIYTVVDAYSRGRTVWVIVFVLGAIVFNPLAPIHMEKGMWVILDLLLASAFVIYLVAADRRLG